MGKKSVQVRIKSTLYAAALAETQQTNCHIKVAEVIENCLSQGFAMLSVLRHCQETISQEDFPNLRFLIDEAIKRAME